MRVLLWILLFVSSPSFAVAITSVDVSTAFDHALFAMAFDRPPDFFSVDEPSTLLLCGGLLALWFRGYRART